MERVWLNGTDQVKMEGVSAYIQRKFNSHFFLLLAKLLNSAKIDSLSAERSNLLFLVVNLNLS